MPIKSMDGQLETMLFNQLLENAYQSAASGMFDDLSYDLLSGALVLQLDFLDIGIECTFSTRNRGGQGCRRVRKFSGGLRKLTRWLG